MPILILAAIAIILVGVYARSRGANPLLWGVIALVGFSAFAFFASTLATSVQKLHEHPAFKAFLNIAPWMWLALVFGYLGFVKSKD